MPDDDGKEKARQRERDLSLIDNLIDAAVGLRDGWKEEVHGEGFEEMGFPCMNEMVGDMESWSRQARGQEAKHKVERLRDRLMARLRHALQVLGREPWEVDAILNAATDIPLSMSLRQYVIQAELVATRKAAQSGSSSDHSPA